MKICPRCQKTYSDDGLNFCLDDGAVLERTAAPDNSIPPTVAFNQPRPTNQPQQFGGQTNVPNAWSNQSQNPMQPPAKKSKTWLWVLGILGGLMLLCGGGFAGLVYIGSRIEPPKDGNYGRTNTNINLKTPTPAVPSKGATQKIDLSEWVKGDTSLGVTEFKNGEFLMSSKKKGYYYVLGSSSENKTENATTKVTVKNVNESETNLGFGLIIHSNPAEPLTQDYAFLIDSENKKYRVVRHVPKDEITVVGWTASSAIEDGTEENVLEVRDQNKKMNFYINGELVKTVNNTDGYSSGVTGIYSGDAVQIAFKNFEVSK